jgi:hypothetical protein
MEAPPEPGCGGVLEINSEVAASDQVIRGLWDVDEGVGQLEMDAVLEERFHLAAPGKEVEVSGLEGGRHIGQSGGGIHCGSGTGNGATAAVDAANLEGGDLEF